MYTKDATLLIENEKIKLKIPYNSIIIKKLKKIKNHQWDYKNNCWVFDNNYEVLRFIKKILIINNFKITEIDNNREDFSVLKTHLLSRKYSQRTITSYLYYNKQFLDFYKKSSNEIKDIDIKNYLAYLNNDLKLSTSTINTAFNALKVYYQDLKGCKFFFNLKRIKRDYKLPDILSLNEVKSIIEVTKNIKHRCMIGLCYSSGLKVSEVSKLKLKDIDFDRKLIHIKSSKFRKDRYVPLSENMHKILSSYIQEYQPHYWLFESWTSEKHISIRTIQKVFDKSKKLAKISKDVSIHSLRHSFATHLLENGIDIKYIKELLGHNSIKTTEIYTHVSQINLKKIKNPFDNI